MAGPLLSMMTQMGGMAFGSQLGQALGKLSREVLTSTDIGLPLGPKGVAALMPEAIESLSEGLEQPRSEIMTFLAAREAAHHRLFSHVPWLASQLLNAVEAFAKGMKIDMSGIEEFAAGFNPASLTDPSQMEQLLNQGIFEPKATPEQTAALERLETLLALIEGWVQTVVNDALGERIPGASALSETLRRRRATGGPAEQTFATLVGLELRPRKLREAAALWEKLTQAARRRRPRRRVAAPRPVAVLRRPRRARRLHRPHHRRRHQRLRQRHRGGHQRRATSTRATTRARTTRRTDSAGLWITRGPLRGCVAESVHDALCAQPGDAGAVPPRRGGPGRLGSAARGAGSSAVRDDHRGARPPVAGPAVRRDARRDARRCRRRRRDHDRRSGYRAGRRGRGDRDAARRAPGRRRSAFMAGGRCRTCWPVRCAARAPGSSTAASPTPPSRPRPPTWSCCRIHWLPTRGCCGSCTPRGYRTCRCGFATAPVWSGRWWCPA